MVTRADFDEWMVPVYAPASFIPVKGKGSHLWDQEGRHYIDFSAGIATNCLGHAHPALVQALMEQAQLIWHTSNTVTNEPVLKLAQWLVSNTFADKIFLCNSGAEANEAALKLARRYGINTGGHSKTEIIAFHQSFHGRTFFTVTTGGQPKYSEGFGANPADITHLPFNDIEAFVKHISERTCAVILELIQGEGGILPATTEFIATVREYCTRYGALLIVDEVQTGVGRTGALYAYMKYGVLPDILTSAKGLGGGFPVAAMLTTETVASHFSFGVHGTTFGGNPLASAVAFCVLQLVSEPVVLEEVERKGLLVRSYLRDYQERWGCFSEIRGMGLMIGAQLAPAYAGQAKKLMQYAASEGLMVLQAGVDVLRIVPSLIIPDDDIHEGMARLEKAIKVWVKEGV
jgi:succinylornithine transaminase family protein